MNFGAAPSTSNVLSIYEQLIEGGFVLMREEPLLGKRR
jgi:hypothetical protein